ncbi:CamS family sex pheromone protein [Oceanobacillus chungangensis]|uniref:CamS family sex pheromone protein n=1 Tax=Oceanobacillus chungangensis TaxID=1229152 RepID=A0A3D8PIQ8_9BACI|nr:CamS family sex pheromone protein [Oceanobacillus chungangensis]RDW15108.1 hypothetical protein CWR45_18230 [Oceanobacillus chungangensis]
MKKIIFWSLCTLLILSSCAPNMDEEEILQTGEINQETSIVPGIQLSEETYGIVTPYKTDVARGLITNQIMNHVDIDEIEEGLRRHSKEVFDSSDLYFQEGQYFTQETLLSWINDLNPERKDNWDEETHRKNPRILSYILEQNYLRKVEGNNFELAGISIGISLKSVYRFQAPKDGPDYNEEIEMEVMLEKGYEVAQTVVERMREIDGLSDIPIMIALYREEDHASPVPGNYVAKTNVPSGSNTIKDWESIDEEHILFPSPEGEEKYLEDYELLKSLENEISPYFPDYVGMIGNGFYANEELQKLTIEIPIEFYSDGELLGFMQHAYGQVQYIFDNNYDLEINITSSNQMVGLISRKAGAESPTVHIFQ